MRFANWDKLKKLIRRQRAGDPINWKDAAILFYGTFLGSMPSTLGERAALTWNPTTVVALVALIIGAICSLAHWSIRQREQGSIDTIMETMDEVEAEFQRR